jgi:glycosyltransferase involved in cell wall biosynthesis
VPQVSILIPTYEPNPLHLRAALECVLAQSCQEWTVFIHDDCSKADVRAIVEPYLHDPRFTFQRSEKRLGIGGNWNACLAKATGEYVQYLFQDDTWKPAYLEKCVRLLEKEKSAGFVAVEHSYDCENNIGTSRSSAYEALATFRKTHVQPGLQSEAFLHWWIQQGLRPNVIGEPSFVMLRRSLMEQVGPFLEDMPQNLDVQYWLRCLLQGPWYNLTENLGSFRVHLAGASTQNDEAGRGLFDRLRLFDYLLMHLPNGKLRAQVERSLSEQIGQMIRKFFQRTKGGGNVNAGGSGAAIKLLLRHPLLLLHGCLQMFLVR